MDQTSNNDDIIRISLDLDRNEYVQNNTNLPLKIIQYIYETIQEFFNTADMIFSSKLTLLFLFGPIALYGDSSKVLNEFTCFILAGLALIPCAERLSYVTEQIANHTNQTVGALLNATFGNVPELLISTAALRSGFYRVVQLTLLGSIITNLLFVFGVACIIGGFEYKVQKVKMVSGNVSVGLLLVTTAGLLLPAAVKIGGKLGKDEYEEFENELWFSRCNAICLVVTYIGYLFFQIKTHREEFEDEDDEEVVVGVKYHGEYAQVAIHDDLSYEEEQNGDTLTPTPVTSKEDLSIPHSPRPQSIPSSTHNDSSKYRRKISSPAFSSADDDDDDDEEDIELTALTVERRSSITKSHASDGNVQNILDDITQEAVIPGIIPLRAGLIWLLSITLCISAMSDILVDTIDGFAHRCHISQIFTSVIIIPFFSNIAEQVSAILFAYRNKMEIVVGVTVGSAIQISLGVIPGCIIIGWFMDRSMSLFFEGYETCSLLIGVLAVSAVLQSGTTNWLVGLYFVAIYIMISVGFWFQTDDTLSIDAEIGLHNVTYHNNGR